MNLEPKLLLESIGFAVELMQQDRWLELLELRRILEPSATALAAERAHETLDSGAARRAHQEHEAICDTVRTRDPLLAP